MSKNIATVFHDIATELNDRLALVEVESKKTYSFDQLSAKTNQYAWHLNSNGVSRGDRVMLMVKPSADFVCLTFALFMIGAPVILIDPGMGYKNLLGCVDSVRPKVFIGIPKARLFIEFFRSSFSSLQLKFCCGNTFGIFGRDLRQVSAKFDSKYPIHEPEHDDLAAILFTTGSTGPPKGVRYEHDIFLAQLQHIKNFYKISKNDVDQPAFPLFALFSISLGALTIIPDMDVTKPAKVNPQKFIQSINQWNVSYSFGSPALWDVVSSYCCKNNVTLPTITKVLMAGAPVSGDLIERVQRIIHESGEVHTPYGATESLPIVSIEGKEIVESTWNQTVIGKGTCVGRPLPGISVAIIPITDGEIHNMDKDLMLDNDEIGEIIVCGDVVTRSYDANETETALSKIHDGNKIWHRMGDVGYLDDQGLLWFCGRKAHRVKTKKGEMYTIPCEAIFNKHPQVNRSALVGVNVHTQYEQPVIIIEKIEYTTKPDKQIISELKNIAQFSELTCSIETFLFHPSFPVDIRHNAKIFREKLKIWATKELNINE